MSLTIRNASALTIAVLAILTGIYLYTKYRVAPSFELSQLELIDLSNQPVDFSSFEDRNLILIFWESWCGPCIRELPSVEQLNAVIDHSKFAILTVSSDSKIPQLISFKRKKQYNFPIYFMQNHRTDVGVHTIPTAYILSSNGEILYKVVGETDWVSEDMLARLEDV